MAHSQDVDHPQILRKPRGSAASTESGSTDSAAADGSVFKIGGIGPTTGAAAIYGSAVMNAAQIAVDEINEAGGINGYQVEFKAEDDQSDAEKSVNAYNSLKRLGYAGSDGNCYNNSMYCSCR